MKVTEHCFWGGTKQFTRFR